MHISTYNMIIHFILYSSSLNSWILWFHSFGDCNSARFGQGAHGSGPRRRPALRQPPAKACSFASRAHGSGPPAWICMATASGRESAAELPTLCCTPGASSLALSQVVGLLSLQLGKVILLVRHFFCLRTSKTIICQGNFYCLSFLLVHLLIIRIQKLVIHLIQLIFFLVYPFIMCCILTDLVLFSLLYCRSWKKLICLCR